MNVASRVDFRKGITALSPVSAKAAAEFRSALPDLLSQVSKALESGGFPQGEPPSAEQMEFVLDAQRFLGLTLASVFEFGLEDALADEMEWMARTFRGRGIGPAILRRTCRVWIIALHGAVRTPVLKETVPPFELISAHADDFFSVPSRGEAAPDPGSSAFLRHLLDNRKDDAVQAALVHSGKHTIEATVTSLFLYSLEAIGQLWCDNRISVADEHLATANARWVASRFFASLKRHPGRRQSVSVSAVPGDEHSLGAELLSRYLDFRGWTVLFLGQSMPESELIRALEKEKPGAAVITVGMIAHLPAFRRTVIELRKRVPDLRIFAATSRMKARPVLEALTDGVPGSFEACGALLAETGKRHET